MNKKREIRLGILGNSLTILIIALAISCLPIMLPEKTEPLLIVRHASELALTLEDFPSGWRLWSEGATDEGHQKGYYSRMFVHQRKLILESVVCGVNVFSTIDEAEKEYDAILSQASDKYSIDELQVGDEDFAYKVVGHGYVFRSVFREKNVIGIIDRSTMLYSGSFSEVKKYAEKLERKIS